MQTITILTLPISHLLSYIQLQTVSACLDSTEAGRPLLVSRGKMHKWACFLVLLLPWGYYILNNDG
jgi:hypothetical protein